jgi:LemA protein
MIGIGFLILAIILFLILVSVGGFVNSYNIFVSLRQDIKTQFSNIITEYQRRTDMFYNLVQGVKSYKKHENTTLKEVVEARNMNFGQSKKQDMKNIKQLDGMFGRLMAVIEAYPNLKADEQHNKLMDEVRITEDRINVSRTDYNNIVNTYNTRVKSFPSNIIAGMFNFGLEKYFEGQEGVEKAPKIELE